MSHRSYMFPDGNRCDRTKYNHFNRFTHFLVSSHFPTDGQIALQRKNRLLQIRSYHSIAVVASFPLSGINIAAFGAVVVGSVLHGYLQSSPSILNSASLQKRLQERYSHCGSSGLCCDPIWAFYIPHTHSKVQTIEALLSVSKYLRRHP